MKLNDLEQILNQTDGLDDVQTLDRTHDVNINLGIFVKLCFFCF